VTFSVPKDKHNKLTFKDMSRNALAWVSTPKSSMYEDAKQRDEVEMQTKGIEVNKIRQ